MGKSTRRETYENTSMNRWPTGRVSFDSDLDDLTLANILRSAQWLAVSDIKARWNDVVCVLTEVGQAISISSQMIDVAERDEVGRLMIKRVPGIPGLCEQRVRLPEGSRSIAKLISTEADLQIESGLEIQWEGGQMLVVVSNAMPCTLAIAAPFYPNNNFEPEYELSRYTRQKIQ